MLGSTVDTRSCVIWKSFTQFVHEGDLKVDSRPALLSPLAGVFNASDNFGKLHRLEIRPKSRQFLVNSEWNSDDVNVHPVLLKSVTREAHGRERFRTKMVLCPAA